MRLTKREVAKAVAAATDADIDATYNAVRGLLDRGLFPALTFTGRGYLFDRPDVCAAAILCDALASGLDGGNMRDLANTLYQGRRAIFATGESLEINVANLLPRILAGEEWAIETSWHRQPDGTVEPSSHWVRLTADGYPDRLGADYPVIAATIRPVSELVRKVAAILDGAA